MMLHVSDLEHAKKCPALFFQARKNRPAPASYYHLVTPFSSLWRQKLNLADAPGTNVGADTAQTLDLLAKSDAVLNARFEWNGLRVRIPVLKKMPDGQGFEAIYPYLSTSPKESELYRMKINDLTAQRYGIEIRHHSILYINKDYVRAKELDAEKLLLQSSHLFKKRSSATADIDALLQDYPLDLEAEIQQAVQLLEQQEARPQRNKYCTASRKCIYYEDCFDEESLPDDSVLFLTTSHYRTGKSDLSMAQISDLSWNEIDGFWLQHAQYQASRNGGQYMDGRAVASWLKDISYPISYLDFEWDTFAFPPFENMHPLEVVCFQYSLHIERKDGTLSHTDFFGDKDCRRNFIESLIASVPKEGTILVYNMEGAEKLRLIQLSEQFPEYKEALEQIWSRMKDLSKPFENGLFYDSRQRGHYSLKSLLPVFSEEKSYKALDIQNGLNAVMEYRTYDLKNEEEKEILKKNLSTYCALDTYAEYILYHGLKERVKEFES